MQESTALITNDAVTLGLLAVILGSIFYTAASQHPFWQRFYRFVPALLLCYFIPSIFNTFGVIDGDSSNLYYVASRYLLPTCLVLLTLSIDLKGVVRLGPKAIIMFLTGTVGIVIGGPIAIMAMSAIAPDMFGGQGPDAVWRGMTTVAGSWIGGGANQAAMKEIFEVGDDIFAAMVAVDVLIASLWMAVMLYVAGESRRIDRWLGADTTAIEDLRERVEHFQKRNARLPSLTDFMLISAVGFGLTGIAHAFGAQLADYFQANFPALDRFSLTSNFFWIIVIATTAGLGLSFTRVRTLEGAGASKVGSAFLYILVATIGMHMDIRAVVEAPKLFALGGIWMAVHAGLLLFMAWMLRAPMFYMAVGSQANVGGAASAPVVASAFHPSLAPVGVLLAVLGYAVGTYAAWFCGQLLRVLGS